ncbi:hypothetical protein B0H14DRAFT_2700387 [Mycena olivaceomarginata]|nr:hypothetical protein B0H14DRAFT_2700387 [Mycena olivaceomarginata]
MNLAILGLFAGAMIIWIVIGDAGLDIWGRFLGRHSILFVIICSPIALVIVRRIAQRTSRNLRSRRFFPRFSNAALLRFPRGIFQASDWSIRNPVGLMFMGLILLIFCLSHGGYYIRCRRTLFDHLCKVHILPRSWYREDTLFLRGTKWLLLYLMLAFFASGFIRMACRLFTGWLSSVYSYLVIPPRN